MTTPRNIDQLIKAYLAYGPAELPDRSFEAVRGEIEGTRQRLPIGLPRLPLLSDSERLVAVAALVLVAFVGFNVLGPFGRRGTSGPPATPSVEPTPSVAPAASVEPTPSVEPTSIVEPRSSVAAAPVVEPTPIAEVTPTPPPVPETVAPGTFRLTAEFPVPVTVSVPAGWGNCSNGPLEQAVCGDGEVSFMIIDNVVTDPCFNMGRYPPVGPTVDELATAIAALPGFHATSPVDVTVDGHPGKELTVTAPLGVQCDWYTWMGPDRTNGVGPGEVNRLRIVDVDGTRVLIAAAFHPTAAAPLMPAEENQVFESVRFP